MTSISKRAAVSTFLRSFLVQGSWNYHTMLGCGFAFALLPGLRELYGADSEELRKAARSPLRSLQRPSVSRRCRARCRTEARVRRRRLRHGASLQGSRARAARKSGRRARLGDMAARHCLCRACGVLARASRVALGRAVSAALQRGPRGTACLGAAGGSVSRSPRGRELAAADLLGRAERLKPAMAIMLGMMTGALVVGPDGLLLSGALWGRSGRRRLRNRLSSGPSGLATRGDGNGGGDRDCSLLGSSWMSNFEAWNAPSRWSIERACTLGRLPNS